MLLEQKKQIQQLICNINTYEELYSYIKGMSDLVDMIDIKNKVKEKGDNYDM